MTTQAARHTGNDSATLSCYRRVLTHLTAVSGANVTIVCGAVLLMAGLVGPRFAVALAAVALVAFVVVVQPSASVLRAAVMGAITLLAVVSHRRRQVRLWDRRRSSSASIHGRVIEAPASLPG